jgi:hypothetical protein
MDWQTVDILITASAMSVQNLIYRSDDQRYETKNRHNWRQSLCVISRLYASARSELLVLPQLEIYFAKNGHSPGLGRFGILVTPGCGGSLYTPVKNR